MELIIVVVAMVFVYLFGIISGWRLRELHATQQMAALEKELEESIGDEVKKHLIKIRIEKHNDMFYVYDYDANSFMAQGTSKTDLEEKLRVRYPGKTFAADNKNLQEVGFE